jgi:hypothetical protein
VKAWVKNPLGACMILQIKNVVIDYEIILLYCCVCAFLLD